MSFLNRLNAFLIFMSAIIVVGCGSSKSSVDPATTTNTQSQNSVANGSLRLVIDRSPHSKSATGQRLLVYENNDLVSTFVISTGRETFDIPPLYNISPYCSITPKGVFRPTRLVEMHYSNTWATAEVLKDSSGRVVIDPDTLKPQEIIHRAEMPWSVFFKGGVAIHGTEHVDQLGRPASGACVRVLPEEAQTIYNLVASRSAEDVTIEVIDSRPQLEQDVIADRCAADQAWYTQANKECFDEQKARVANNKNPHQKAPVGFFGKLFGKDFLGGTPKRELTEDEVIAVKKYCRAQLRAELKARRQ